MKIGLVLEGGASRALFSAGVMDSFLDNNINADFVVGVSAGICNGMSYVSGQKGRAHKTSTYFSHKEYMGIKHLLNPKKRSYYNLDFAFGTVPNEYIPFNHEAYHSSGEIAVAGVTNIETGQIEFLKVPAYDTSWKVLIASCALPILFQPVEIDGKKYLDGGIGDAIPVGEAIRRGCDKIIVITTREKSYTKTKDTGAAFAAKIYRKYPNLTPLLKNRAELYNKAKENLAKLEMEGRVFWIAPSDTSNWGRTDKSQEKLDMMYKEGYETGLSLLEDLRKYLAK